jgi:hypothetical protein
MTERHKRQFGTVLVLLAPQIYNDLSHDIDIHIGSHIIEQRHKNTSHFLTIHRKDPLSLLSPQGCLHKYPGSNNIKTIISRVQLLVLSKNCRIEPLHSCFESFFIVSLKLPQQNGSSFLFICSPYIRFDCIAFVWPVQHHIDARCSLPYTLR